MPVARATLWQTVRRFVPVAIASSVALLIVSSGSIGEQHRPSPLSPLSIAMHAEGVRLLAERQADAAQGYFETALVADPRNADAFVGMGDVARAQNLPGKAIGYFREALALSPGHRVALLGQGQALVARGAIDRARENLAALQAQCGERRCAEVAALTNAINAAGERTALRPEEVMPRPVVEAVPAAN
jgi:tetratricopeptide (TPR) repeat protein